MTNLSEAEKRLIWEAMTKELDKIPFTNQPKRKERLWRSIAVKLVEKS